MLVGTQRSKFLQWIDFRVRLTIQDGRMIVGTFLAFDKHMNIVLAEAQETRIIKSKKTGSQKMTRRRLGLVIVRGDNIVSLTAQAPPAQTQKNTDELNKPGKANVISRPAIIPNQNQDPAPVEPPPSLVGPSDPYPSSLRAPNVTVNLPKPPAIPPSLPPKMPPM